LRIEINNTRNALDFVKVGEYLGSQQSDANGDLIRKYIFPMKYGDGMDIELFLVSRNEKVVLADQGRTIAFLDKIFELREPDVIKNLSAIMKHYNVLEDKEHSFYIPLESWQNDQGEESIELIEAVYSVLYSCITFMEAMKVFYI
jgi:hypothetical protein